MESKPLWQPSPEFVQHSNLTHFSNWLKEYYGLHFENYHSLWEWSTRDTSDFWKAVAEYFAVKFHALPEHIQSYSLMPNTEWFPGATLNYVEHIFLKAAELEKEAAIYFQSELKALQIISWAELKTVTASVQRLFKRSGVVEGDRVAAYLPNIPEASMAFLAATAMGAVWSSCSPDFGTQSVLDRFRQIEPKVFIAVDGYTYNGKIIDRKNTVREILQQLPTVELVILIPYLKPSAEAWIAESILWGNIPQEDAGNLEFNPVLFSHPLWILYSSGTTGIPKAIVHSHGGCLLEHLKYLHFHNDVKVGERFFWFTTTGWMMWNFVHASLLAGAAIVLYDGSPGYPDLEVLWKLAAEVGIHHFGTSAPFLVACMKNGLEPGNKFDLTTLRSIGSTGSPLPPEAYGYVYSKIKNDLWLCSMSGGTDVCTAFVGGCPWLPVYSGEIQCRTLGCELLSYDEMGHVLEHEVGEMVITKAMPSMPVFFWNDKQKEKYKASYFDMYAGVWRHGDWVRITEHNGIEIQGRSDATLNRQGVRIGTAEIYRTLDKLPAIQDSLIVNVEGQDGSDWMPLFVIVKQDFVLDEELKKSIKDILRREYSPRHIPDDFFQVNDIPYTISGKKMETPVKKILMGKSLESVVNPGSMRNPESLEYFVQLRLKRLQNLESRN